LSTFLGGGSQGAIRWGAGLDTTNFDQGINKVKTGMTSLAAPTQQLNANLTKQNTLLGQTATQTKTLGSSVRDMGSRFGSFAVGISATTTSVLALGAGFRDYNDAQIAVDRQTRRVSLAQEALVKANDKLNKLQKSGTATSKELAAANLDVAQANSFLKTQTELLGERQETLFDTQSRFVATLAPAIIGTVGSLTMAFKDLGLNFGKLKGAFTGIGSTIGNFVGSLTGVGAAGVTAGAGTTVAATGVKGLDASAKSAALSVKGLAGALGLIAIPIAGLLLGKEALDVNADAAARLGVETKSLTQRMLEGDTQFGKSKAEVADYGKEVDKFRSGPIGGMLAVIGDLIMSIPGVSDAVKGLAKETTGAGAGVDKLNTSGGNLIKWITPTTTGVEQLKGGLDLYVQSATSALNTGSSNVEVFKALTAAGLNTKDATDVLAIATRNKLYPALQQTGAAAKASTSIESQLAKARQDLLNQMPSIAKGENTIAQAQLAGNKQAQDYLTTTENNAVTLERYRAGLAMYVKDRRLATNADMLSVAQLEALVQGYQDTTTWTQKLAQATHDGVTSAQEFMTQTKLNIVTDQARRGVLFDLIQASGDLTIEEDASIQALEQHAKVALGDKVALEELSKAADEARKVWRTFSAEFSKAEGLKAVFDIKVDENKLLEKFKKALPDKIKKDLKLDLKTEEKEIKFTPALDEVLQGLITATEKGTFEWDPDLKITDKRANEIAKSLVTSIDSFFGKGGPTGQFKGLSDSIKESIAGPDTASKLLQILTSQVQGAPDIKVPLVPELGGAGGGGTSRFATSPFFATIQQKAQAALEGVKLTLPAPDVNEALGAMGEVKRGWDTVAGQIRGAAAVLTVNADQALDMIGETKRGWDKTASQVESKIPKLKVNADQALDMIGETKRGWDKAAGQIQSKVPKLKVNADQALDMIGEVTRGLNKIKDKTVTVTIKTVGKASAQGGMHETLSEDTLIQAHRGERVDIGRGGAGIRSAASNGGSGSGDIIIESHTHIMNEDIVRRMRAQAGKNRYRFGA
jgi:predicted  nucleic acid-binding Zn-ribbon protein